MINHSVDIPNQKVAKFAGFLFLLSLLVPLFNWTFILSKLIVTENAIDTAHNILTNEFLFRINIINEVLISAVATALAVALYIMLKSVNKNLALLALFLKLTESILSAIIALGHTAALLMLTDKSSLSGLEPKQIQAFIGLFLNVHILVTAIPGIFLGLNLVIFLSLLYKSNYVPRWLSGFGVLSYTLIFIYDSSMILLPNFSTILIVQIIGWGPSILFEVLIGIWLLFKGIKVQI
ncbi:MAG: DUF4386 domain-containing protein [archaeon]